MVKDVPSWSGFAQRRRVRRMLRRMRRLEHKPIRVRTRPSSGGGVRGLSAVLVGIAASSIGVAVLADRSADMIHTGVWTVSAAPGAWPAKPQDAGRNPLGLPPEITEAGTFKYVATQAGSTEPVSYSPCQPIHIVVNTRTAIPGHEELLRDAVAEVSRASGLRFIFDGTTDRAPDRRPPTHAPDGRGWEPVLVAWSDENEVPELAGNVAGLGGSARVPRGRHEWLVTGTVVIDGADAARTVRHPHGRSAVRAVILHEFGHVLGLDHVQDGAELMHAGASQRQEFGNGDLAGLAALGSGECVDW